MLAALQHRHRQFEMRADRCRDRDSVDIRIAYQILIIRRGLHGRKTAGGNVELLLIEIRYGRELCARKLRKVARQVRPPIAMTYNADVDHALLSEVALR